MMGKAMAAHEIYGSPFPAIPEEAEPSCITEMTKPIVEVVNSLSNQYDVLRAIMGNNVRCV